MKYISLFIAVFVNMGILVTNAYADVPSTLHHQGRISVQGVNFEGTGDFRFLLYYAKTSGVITRLLWKNDDQKPETLTVPTTPVTVAVTKGLYSVQLGASPQVPLPLLAPSSDEQLYLRIWFDDGVNGIQQLSPDREISSVPFALRAASVANGSITSASLSSSIDIPNVLAGVEQIPVPQYWVSPQHPFSATFPTAFPSAPIVSSTPGILPTTINEITASGFSGTVDFPAAAQVPSDTITTESVATISAAIVDGRPAVSFSGDDGQTLKFAINASADGSGAWAISSIATGQPATGGLIGFSSLTVIDGKPAIAFQEGSPLGILKFAINSAADGSGIWSINTVAPGVGAVIGAQSLAMIDGRPAIAFSDSNVTPGQQFAINTAADGSGTWNLSDIGFPGLVFEGAALAVVDGRPAIAYHDQFGGLDSSLRFAINSMADATGSWTMTIVRPAGSQGVPYHFPRLALVNGFPAISFYFSGSTNSTVSSQRYRINTEVDATGSWNGLNLLGAQEDLIGAGSDIAQSGLAVIGGIPVVTHSADREGTQLEISVLTPTSLENVTLAEESAGSEVVDLGRNPGIFFINDGLKFWTPKPLEVNWIAVEQ